MAELADALVSGTSGRKAVEVQVLSRAIETDIKNKRGLEGNDPMSFPGIFHKKIKSSRGQKLLLLIKYLWKNKNTKKKCRSE